MRDLSKDERSLLLYLETCAVDYSGRVNPLRMNDTDREILQRWVDEDFLASGRIVVADCNRDGSMWVRLSNVAWETVHAERRTRATRQWEEKRYCTTKEARRVI